MNNPKHPNARRQNGLFRGALQTVVIWLASLGLAAVAEVPHIDKMASDWLVVDEIVHMPSLHNFHEMGACSPELLGVNYLPGGPFYAGSGKRWYEYNTLPLVRLMINGQMHEATRCRWVIYRTSRMQATANSRARSVPFDRICGDDTENLD